MPPSQPSPGRGRRKAERFLPSRSKLAARCQKSIFIHGRSVAAGLALSDPWQRWWRELQAAAHGRIGLSLAYPDECHDFDKALLVVDGPMKLLIENEGVEVGAGDVFIVPEGTPHAVAAGSHGSLVIIDR